MTKSENFYRKGLGGNFVGLCIAERGSLIDIKVAPCIGPYPLCLKTILALKTPSLRSQGSSATWGLPLILRSHQTQYLPGIYERPLRLAHCWSQPQVLDYCEWSKAKENNADGWAQAELACPVTTRTQTTVLICKLMK